MKMISNRLVERGPPLLTLSRFSKFMSASSIGTVLVAGGGDNERRRRHVALLPTIRRSE